MNISLMKSLLAAALLTLAAVGASAQEYKIGYVDSERVLRESAPAKAASARLKVIAEKFDKDLGEVNARVKAAADKLEKEAPTLSESERARRQRELIDQDRELQRKRREFEEDFNQRKNEERISISERAQKIIKQLQEQEKYDLIFTEGVYFFSPRVDITDKVIKALNAQPAPPGK